MLDGRFQCLTCSKHVTGIYQGKEHAPHVENTWGEIVAVPYDQAGRIPICDKCSRPVTSDEQAFKHDIRYYHLECARCNRCRKKLFKVPCRKLGSALGKFINITERRKKKLKICVIKTFCFFKISFSLSHVLINSYMSIYLNSKTLLNYGNLRNFSRTLFNPSFLFYIKHYI